jgi:hypothetical protein
MKHTVRVGTQKVIETKEGQRVGGTSPSVNEKEQKVFCMCKEGKREMDVERVLLVKHEHTQ